MTKQANIFLMAIIALTACSNPVFDKAATTSTEINVVTIEDQNNSGSSDTNKDKIKTNTLPIHGELSKQQVEKYYPKITDTIKDLRIIGSEPLEIQATADIFVSMLHNVGTFDQMFLCTHDKKFNLLDCYYVGKRTMFDGTSRTIEYKK